MHQTAEFLTNKCSKQIWCAASVLPWLEPFHAGVYAHRFADWLMERSERADVRQQGSSQRHEAVWAGLQVIAFTSLEFL